MLRSQEKAFHPQTNRLRFKISLCDLNTNNFSPLERLPSWYIALETESRRIQNTRSQFHQHFTFAFFVRKCFEQLFSGYILALEFLASKFRTKNARVKH